MINIKIDKNLLGLNLKILFSIALVSCALIQIDWHAFSITNLKFQTEHLAVALLTIIFAYVLASSRWYFLLKAVGFEGGFFECVKLYFAAGLINQGVPSTLGGDSYRAIKASRLIKNDRTLTNNKEKIKFLNMISNNFRLSIGVLMIDRIIGLVGNNLVGAFGLIIGGYKIAIWGQKIGFILLFLTLSSIIIIFIIFNLRISRVYLYKLFNKIKLKRLFFVLYSFASFKIIFIHVFVAILIHLLNVLAFGCCLRALGEEMSLYALMIGLPLTSVFTMIPLSVSGWGVREVTLSAILSLWGIEPAIVVLASISYGLLTLVAMFPGVYFLLKNRNIKINDSIKN
jgi:uncharacterized membrane protein YbhN (UPF0104 family)